MNGEEGKERDGKKRNGREGRERKASSRATRRLRPAQAQRVVSCLNNARKLANMHLKFQKYVRGLYPGPSLKWGRGGMGWEGGGGRERKGTCVPNDFSFRCAAPDLLQYQKNGHPDFRQ
jgi:hypothetical protein